MTESHNIVRVAGVTKEFQLGKVTVQALKGIDLEIPLGKFTVLTGVSGSGKSTAVHDTLYRALAARKHRARRPAEPFRSLEGDDRLGAVVLVDQTPIGRSPPRPWPATACVLSSTATRWRKPNRAASSARWPSSTPRAATSSRWTPCPGS